MPAQPGAVRLRQTGDIFRRLVSENPAGEATPGREQSAGYARRRHLMRDCGRGFDSRRLHWTVRRFGFQIRSRGVFLVLCFVKELRPSVNRDACHKGFALGAYHERTMNAVAQLPRAAHRPPSRGRAFWWAD